MRAKIANPVKSTCTSTTPLLSERAGGDACLSSLHSKIDPSKLDARSGVASEDIMSFEEGDCFQS